MAFSRCQFHPKQSRNLLTLILVQIFLCVQDGNSPCRCWNGIAWAKDTHIYLHLFVFKQTRLTICTVSVLFIHHLIQWIEIVNLWKSGEVGYHQRYSPLGAHTRKKKFRLYGICPLPTQEEKFIRYGIFAAGRVVVLTQEKKISRVWDLRACRDAY